MKRILKIAILIVSIIFCNKVSALEFVTNDNELKLGSEVCYKTECFYVLDNNDKEIKLLAKYNLNVGGDYNTNNTYTPYTDYTNLQSSNMLGHIGEGIVAKGTLIYGESSDYNQSKIKQYVDTYKEKLENMGAEVKSASLITKEELIKLGCNENTTSCRNAPNWVYSTSYWTITPGDTYFEWIVLTDSKFDQTYYGAESAYGVRPVITLVYDSDATIKTINPNVGIISPEVKKDITEYKILIPEDTDEIEFEIETTSNTAKIISGEKCEIKSDTKECEIVIEAQNKEQKKYKIEINKEIKEEVVENPKTGSTIKIAIIIIGIVFAIIFAKIQIRKPIKNI